MPYIKQQQRDKLDAIEMTYLQGMLHTTLETYRAQLDIELSNRLLSDRIE